MAHQLGAGCRAPTDINELTMRWDLRFPYWRPQQSQSCRLGRQQQGTCQSRAEMRLSKESSWIGPVDMPVPKPGMFQTMSLGSASQTPRLGSFGKVLGQAFMCKAQLGCNPQILIQLAQPCAQNALDPESDRYCQLRLSSSSIFFFFLSMQLVFNVWDKNDESTVKRALHCGSTSCSRKGD